MSIQLKSKFAGFLRGLLGRLDKGVPPRPAAAAAPAAPTATTKRSAPTAAATPTPAITGATWAGNSDEIELPLASVVAGLPMELRAKLVAAPPAGSTIRLQAEMIIGQLAFGAVKLSFGELRRLAPGIFINSGGELDNKLVNLPLQEILPRLNPVLLARRSTKKVEVAEEISGPFAERGRGFTFTTQPLKGLPAKPLPSAPVAPEEPAPKPAAPIAFTAPTATPAPAPPPPPAPTPTLPPASAPATARQVSPPIASSFTPRSITPAPSSHSGMDHPPISPVSLSPLSPRPIAPLGGNGNGFGGANSHGNGHANGHANGHGISHGGSNGGSNGNGSNGNGHASIPPLPPGLRLGSMNSGCQNDTPPLKMSPQPATPSPAAPPAPPLPAIFLQLSDLCENWPSELKEQILQSPLGQVKVPLESAAILPGLKRGRVVVTWKQLRSLAQPDSAPSPHDSLELELPLKVIAPLFLAAQKTVSRPQSRMIVAEEIPDLFFGFPQPSPAPIAPVPLAPPVAPMAPMAPTPSKPQDTNYFARADKADTLTVEEPQLRRTAVPQTDFMSRQAHPKEVVARASVLDGVAGSLVAMPDGLRVASQVPAEFNPDTLSAFLPQIFERVNQSTRELRMGALNNINFTVGNVPWKIFRVNSVYFAAFGHAGAQLPSAQLAQLAAELDRKLPQ